VSERHLRSEGGVFEIADCCDLSSMGTFEERVPREIVSIGEISIDICRLY
jgi:hypothetical protein